jgi:hypothetical protein
MEIRYWRRTAAAEVFLVSEDSRESEVSIGKVAMEAGDLGLERERIGRNRVGRSGREISLCSRCKIPYICQREKKYLKYLSLL